MWFVLCAALATPARAAGHYLLKLEGIYGLSEQGLPQAGAGVSLVDDGLHGWLLMGEPDDGHRVKRWWIEAHQPGPQLGVPPDWLSSGDEDDDDWPPFLVRYRFGRLGGESSTRRRFVIDRSSHVVLNIPGFWGIEAPRAHFGPSLGLGGNLTWWERWKDTADITINTGKITAEAGWVAGVDWDERMYAQARAVWHSDLFGIHQHNLSIAGAAGLDLGRPFGLELTGELDQGNDTVTTTWARTWSARAVLYYRASPSRDEVDPDELERLRELLDELERMEPDPPPPPGPDV